MINKSEEKMSKIVVYSKQICPYCVKAKALLKRKNLEFEEIMVNSQELQMEMIEKSGGRMTVPQIFIDDKSIGGCDELYELEASGELDKILS